MLLILTEMLKALTLDIEIAVATDADDEYMRAMEDMVKTMMPYVQRVIDTAEAELL